MRAAAARESVAGKNVLAAASAIAKTAVRENLRDFPKITGAIK
jgi:hypothetical protein